MSAPEIVPVCSVCQRVHVRGGGRDAWVRRPELLSRPPSRLSHGYCPHCVGDALAELRRSRRAAAAA